MSNIKGGIHKVIMSMAWNAARFHASFYQLHHEHPIASGKGHAAAIKRQAKKRRKRK